MDCQKTVVVTGASDGIGAAAARALSAHGHEVLVVGRSPEKTRAVAQEIGAQAFTADFSRLEEVRRLAEQLQETAPRIDVLANNAGGLFGKERELTEDGHEKTYQVNVLAPFLLTQLLLPRLQQSRATVVWTSSLGHRFADLDPRALDLDARGGYSSLRAYGNSKLADLLLSQELDRRHRADGVASAAFHPGVIGSNFSQSSDSLMGLAYKTPVKRLMPDSDAGADTLVWLAEGVAGQDFGSGTYYAKRRPGPVSPRAADTLLAERVWDAVARDAQRCGTD